MRQYMHDDNCQDQACDDRRCCNQQREKVNAEADERVACSLPQSSAAIPTAQQHGAADDQHEERQSNEQHPESPLPTSVPHNDLLSGMGRFMLLRLQGAENERGHEESRREDKQQLRGSDESFE